MSSSRASWVLEQDECLVDILLDQTAQGKRADSGFKKEAWIAVVRELASKLGVHYSAQQVKSRQAQVLLVVDRPLSNHVFVNAA